MINVTNTMYNHRRFWVILSILAGLMVLAPSAQVDAQAPGSGLSISPPSFELSANPGDSVTNTIRVDNTRAESQDISVDVRNFTALGEEGEINLSEQDSTYSLAKWVTVSPSTASIPPGGSQAFQYSVRVPANAEPGGRFGSIVFKTAAKPVTGQSGVSIGQEIGSLLFLKIAGNVSEKSSIASFQSNDKINQYKPVGFTVRVKNDGNVHIKPVGTVTITNFFGKKVASIPLESHNILPGAIRRFDVKWNGDSRFIFGKYTATASVIYGNNHQILTATTSFWGLPYTIMLVCLGVLLLIGILVFRARRRLALAIKVLSGKA